MLVLRSQTPHMNHCVLLFYKVSCMNIPPIQPLTDIIVRALLMSCL
jgi:hypothetical protein